VAGFITELSATPFVLYFLAEYSSLVLLSILGATLFCLSVSLVATEGFLVFVAIWARAVLPRLRYSQLITLGWNGLLPLSTIGIIIILTCRSGG
jgi:NADH:ubiquinone oxidoreductase subunit H